MIRTKKFENLPQITSISPSGKIVVTENGVDKVISFEDFSNLPPANDVWNNPSTTFTASEVNVTDIQSAADSKLLDLKINTVSKFKVDKVGKITGNALQIGDATLASPGYVNISNTGVISFSGSGTGIYEQTFILPGGGGYFRRDGASVINNLAGEQGNQYILNQYGLRLGNVAYVGWSSGNAIAYSTDTFLFRDGAANIIAMRNGVNPQTFRLYNTYTSSTNFERLDIKWDTNVLIIGTEKGSVGGTGRSLKLGAGTGFLNFDFNGPITLQGAGEVQPIYIQATGNASVNLKSSGNQPVVIDSANSVTSITRSSGSSTSNTSILGISQTSGSAITFYSKTNSVVDTELSILGNSSYLRKIIFGGSVVAGGSLGTDVLIKGGLAGTNTLRCGDVYVYGMSSLGSGRSGHVILQHDSSVTTNGNVGIGNSSPLSKLDIAETWNGAAITVTGASGTGSVATITFATQSTVIPVGATVVVSSVNPSGYNGTFVVTASSVTSVSYANATSTAYISGGTIQQLFTAVKVNVTDTASADNSNLLDLQVGGVSKFRVDKNSRVISSSFIGATSASNDKSLPSFRFSTGSFPAGLNWDGSSFDFVSGNGRFQRFTSSGIIVRDTAYFGFGSSIEASGADLTIYRDGSDILAQRRSSNPQSFRIYNTYTDATTFERLNIKWETNVLKIGTEKGSVGGTARAMELQTDGVTRLTMLSNGSSTFSGTLASSRFSTFRDSSIYWSISNSDANDSAHLTLRASPNVANSLCIGGITSSFPAIKRNGASIQIRLADDSSNTTLEAGNIYATGNVGIGTTTPTAPLHLQATSSTNTRESLLKFTVSDAGNDSFHIYNATVIDGAFMPGFGGCVYSSSLRHCLVFKGQTDFANDGGSVPMIVYQAARAENQTDPNNAEYFTINNRPLFAWNNLTTTYMQMSANGNLGLGTVTPAAKLDVVSSSTAGSRFGDGTRYVSLGSNGNGNWVSGNGSVPTVIAAGGNGSIFCYASNGVYFGTYNGVLFGDPGANKAVFSGLVGIGAAPAAKLDIVDTDLAGSGSLAGSILNLAQTWNTTGAPTAIKLNVTNTASGAASNLLDLQVDTVSRFKVNKLGDLTLAGSTGVTLTGGGGFRSISYIDVNVIGLVTSSSGALGFSNGSTGSNYDTALFRDAAGTLAQRNGVNPQAFRLYNTYTDATTFERLNIKWDTNVLKIGTEKGTSGGVARAMEFQTDGVTRLSFSADNIIAHISSTNLITGTQIRIGGQTRLSNRSDGVLQISDSSEAGLNRIQLGGTTSSFPALKRNGAALQIRLADDSANAALETAGLTVVGSASVSGHFSAATKSFLIDHPTKEGKKLQYGVVESNQHSVLVRGKTAENIIELPEEWAGLVHEDSVTVQLTPIGSYQQLFVISQDNQRVVVGGSTGQYNYTIYGERKDVDKLITEI